VDTGTTGEAEPALHNIAGKAPFRTPAAHKLCTAGDRIGRTHGQQSPKGGMSILGESRPRWERGAHALLA